MTDTTLETAEVTENVAEASLNIQDIQNALQIISFAADQGAFKGFATYEKVRFVYDRLSAFVAYAQANPETPVADADESVEA